MIVHTLGVGFPGVMALISSRDGNDFNMLEVSGTTESVFCTFADCCADMMGKVACHSASLRATPRQTGSRVRSSEVHTRPLINL